MGYDLGMIPHLVNGRWTCLQHSTLAYSDWWRIMSHEKSIDILPMNLLLSLERESKGHLSHDFLLEHVSSR